MSEAIFPEELRCKYEPRCLLGSGANGAVYEALRLRDNRLVAIKVLSQFSPDPAAVSRFKREAMIASKDLHPNLVQVFESGVVGSCHYIVSELVAGRTLRSFINQKGRLNERRTLEIGAEVAACLAKLHEKGIVHRDVKPENIMLDNQGRTRLLDLGIARMNDSNERLTKTGIIVGTIRYLAPEQCRFREARPPADVFALGIVMLECLAPDALSAGRESKPGEFMVARATGKEELFIPPFIDVATANLLHKCLTFEAEGRFTDGSKLFEALEKLLDNYSLRKNEVTITREEAARPPDAFCETEEQVRKVDYAKSHYRNHERSPRSKMLLLWLIVVFVVPFVTFLPKIYIFSRNDSVSEQAAHEEQKAQKGHINDCTFKNGVVKNGVVKNAVVKEYDKEFFNFWNDPRERATSSTLRNPPPELPPHFIRLRIADLIGGKMHNSLIGRVGLEDLAKHVTRLIGFVDLFLRLPRDENPEADGRALLSMVAWTRRIVARMLICERSYARAALRGKVLGNWGSLARLVDPSELKEFSRLKGQLKEFIDRDGGSASDRLLAELLHIECMYQYRLFEKCFARLDFLSDREKRASRNEREMGLRQLAILVVRAEGLRRTRKLNELKKTYDEAIGTMKRLSEKPTEEVLRAVRSIAISGLQCCIFDEDNRQQIKVGRQYVKHLLASFDSDDHRGQFIDLIRSTVLRSGNKRLKEALVAVIEDEELQRR